MARPIEDVIDGFGQHDPRKSFWTEILSLIQSGKYQHARDKMSHAEGDDDYEDTMALVEGEIEFWQRLRNSV